MDAEKKIFKKYLVKHEMRHTPQRDLILDIFLKHEEHITAEELYEIVKKKDSSIGQATVYRMLKLLCDADLAMEFDFGDCVTRYEHKFNHLHHDHLICRGCGKTVEVFDSAIEELQNNIAKRHGYELTDHKMYLYGFCDKCKKNRLHSQK